MSSNSGGWNEPEFMFRDPGEEEDYKFAQRRQAKLDAMEPEGDPYEEAKLLNPSD